jgi:hypothetical protein
VAAAKNPCISPLLLLLLLVFRQLPQSHDTVHLRTPFPNSGQTNALTDPKHPCNALKKEHLPRERFG